MHKFLFRTLLAVILPLVGCRDGTDGYIAAAEISERGFARNGEAMRDTESREIRIWGYVDHGNLYGDAGARAILGDWWSGEGPGPTAWRFNLKARKDDAVGQSFPVSVPNDAGRDAVLNVFLADARAGRPTKVFLKGRLSGFDAPTQGGLLTGLYLELQSSREIHLGRPEVN